MVQIDEKNCKKGSHKTCSRCILSSTKICKFTPKLTYPFVVIIYRRLLLKINIASTVLETLLTVRLKIYQTFNYISTLQDNLLLLHTTFMSGYLSTLRMIEIPKDTT